MLLAAGYDVPRQLFVHGYLLLDDRKISKSLGNVLDPLDLVDVYGADAVRFWCARSVSFGQDGVASVEGVRERYERELGNDLGNLLSRTTAMVARYRDGSARRRPVRRLRGRRDPRAARGRRRRAPRRVRPDGGARADLGGRARPQPPRRGDGALAAREGRVACGRARPRALRPGRRAARRGRRPRRPISRRRPSGSSPRCVSRRRSSGPRSPTDGPGGRRPRAGRAALPARRRADARRRDRHPRAPRRVRRRAGRARSREPGTRA